MQKTIAPPFGTKGTNNALEEASRLDANQRGIWLKTNLHELPDSLYKYVSFNPDNEESCENLRDIIVRSCLWLSSPKHFNDPFDMTLHLEFSEDGPAVREFVKKQIKNANPQMSYAERGKMVEDFMSKPEESRQRIRKVFRKKIESVGVCCFSEDQTNILMWSHYAKNHSGFAMQFSVVQDVRVFARSLPVNYSQEYPIVTWPAPSGTMDKNVILGKHEGWGYEKEWRIIHPTSSDSLLQFKPEALTGIYIGCRVSDKSKGKLKEFLQERSNLGYPPPKLYRVKKHLKKFKLLVEPE